jgi:hypothetical protein
MADMLWVRIRTGIHHMTRHAVRLDDSTSTMCGLEIAEEDEVVDRINVTDDVCNNCLRILAGKTDVEPDGTTGSDPEFAAQVNADIPPEPTEVQPEA